MRQVSAALGGAGVAGAAGGSSRDKTIRWFTDKRILLSCNLNLVDMEGGGLVDVSGTDRTLTFCMTLQMTSHRGTLVFPVGQAWSPDPGPGALCSTCSPTAHLSYREPTCLLQPSHVALTCSPGSPVIVCSSDLVIIACNQDRAT